MKQPEQVTGMVLSTFPIGESDKRILLLTREMGKVTAFARGAGRQGNLLWGATQAFAFGTFQLVKGHSAYSLQRASISRYFEELRTNEVLACYGFYFLEVADYYTREGADEAEMLKLLYVALEALIQGAMPPPLVRRTYEMRAVVLNGEGPLVNGCCVCGKEDDLVAFSSFNRGMVCRHCALKNESLQAPIAVQKSLIFITEAPLEKLFSFTLSQEAFARFDRIIGTYWSQVTDRSFKSLKVLEALT